MGHEDVDLCECLGGNKCLKVKDTLKGNRRSRNLKRKKDNMPKKLKPRTKTDRGIIGPAIVKVISKGLQAGAGAVKSAASFISSIDFPNPKQLSMSPIDRKK